MTTTPGAQPLNAIRQAALDLMRTRKVIAIEVQVVGAGNVLIMRQDVQESDMAAAKMLRALRGEA